jgi:hypothetical protein
MSPVNGAETPRAEAQRVILPSVSALPVSSPPGWPVAFRGSAAIADGVVTAKALRGPRFVRIFPDTYVRRGAERPICGCGRWPPTAT